YAIGAGAVPPSPGELMMSSKVGQLIKELNQCFDYVVIDSSPVGQVADTYNLAPYADSTLYIVRYNYTYKTQLAILQEIYRNKRLNRPMVVLNDAKNENAYGYGYSEGKKKAIKV